MNLLGPIREHKFKDNEVGKVPEDLSLNLVRDLIDQSFADEDGKKKKKSGMRKN